MRTRPLARFRDSGRPLEFPLRLGAISLVALAIGGGAAASAEDWPQFRGPNSSGISTSDKPLPVTFSKSQNVAWSIALGDGIGSPVVADGRVFVSSMEGDETVRLTCVDANSGKALWSRDLATGPLAEIHQTNSHASTTCAADSERVYFYFSTLGMMAFDARAGEPVWHTKLPVPYFVFKWGPGVSPVLFDDKVIFVQDDDLHPALYALDRRTGTIAWQVERNDMAVNYSHPVICQTDSGPELIVAGTGKLIAYDPATGEQLWFARTLLRNIKTTPVCHDGIVYLSLQSAGIANQWLETADRVETGNNDGRLTKAEMQAFAGDVQIPEAFMRRFDRGDTNGDGYLEGPELDKAFLDPENFAGARFDAVDSAEQFILAVCAGGRGDVTKSHVLWKHNSRAPDHIVSPLVFDGRMFVVKGGGISSCFDTRDGKPIWYQRRIQNVGDYFASPVYGDGKIYVTGENGTVVVLAAGPDLKMLAANDLGDSCLATPAIADGRLYFRTRRGLICVANAAP
jgi:outer membrane protein assembly factor BamB